MRSCAPSPSRDLDPVPPTSTRLRASQGGPADLSPPAERYWPGAGPRNPDLPRRGSADRAGPAEGLSDRRYACGCAHEASSRRRGRPGHRRADRPLPEGRRLRGRGPGRRPAGPRAAARGRPRRRDPGPAAARPGRAQPLRRAAARQAHPLAARHHAHRAGGRGRPRGGPRGGRRRLRGEALQPQGARGAGPRPDAPPGAAGGRRGAARPRRAGDRRARGTPSGGRARPST